jgi:hypothetical protein
MKAIIKESQGGVLSGYEMTKGPNLDRLGPLYSGGGGNRTRVRERAVREIVRASHPVLSSPYPADRGAAGGLAR